MQITPNIPVLYFDGVCNLCNGAVQYVIKRDKKKRFHFASLQSEAGEAARNELMALHGKMPDSLILSYGTRYYLKSDAVLQTALLLGGIYKSAVIFFIVPRFLRDMVYDWVARNRYTWYGKKDACMVPTPELQSRFLK